MPDVASVAIGFWVAVGSRDESDEVAGASHFLEHLLFKGSDRWSAQAIAEAVDASGGEMNAFTAKEHTAFYLRVLATGLDAALDILSDIVWAPALVTADVESERQVILEELLLHGDEPDDLVHDVLTAALFPGHPLGREILGEAGTVKTMTADAIRDFHRGHYRPGNVIVAAAGWLDHDAVAAAVERRLVEPGEAGERPVRCRPDGPTDAVVVAEDDTEQAHIAIGVRGLGVSDPDRYALALLDQALGGGLSSRLFQEIREKRGLAYSVYSSRAAYSDTGVLSFYAGTSPGRAVEVVELIVGELASVASAGITERELEVAKAHVRGATLLGLEDSASRLARVAHSQIAHGEVLPVEETLAKFDAVSGADVARVAGEVLGQPRSLAVVGPFDDAAFAGIDGIGC